MTILLEQAKQKARKLMCEVDQEVTQIFEESRKSSFRSQLINTNSNLELRFCVLKYFLTQIRQCQSLIEDKGYTELSGRKYRKKFEDLYNVLRGELVEVVDSYVNKGMTKPNCKITYQEFIKYIKTESSLQDYWNSIQEISGEIQNKSQSLTISVIKAFDCSPEWLFPTSTFSSTTDIALVKSFVD